MLINMYKLENSQNNFLMIAECSRLYNKIDSGPQHIQLLEMAMIQQEVNAPVYFARWTPDFEDILRDLQHSFITDDKSGTALEAMLNTVSSNGYQIGKFYDINKSYYEASEPIQFMKLFPLSPSWSVATHLNTKLNKIFLIRFGRTKSTSTKMVYRHETRYLRLYFDLDSRTNR